MRKETVTYTDYNGNERTEDFYFNLNKAEMLELEVSFDGGMGNFIQMIVETEDKKRLVEIFKTILLKAYGEKSADGRRLLKYDLEGHSLAEMNFVPTEAYSDLYIRLATDDQMASSFLKEIMPKDMSLPDDKKDQKVLPGPGATMTPMA